MVKWRFWKKDKKDEKIETYNLNREVKDVVVHVAEGLSDTRVISISAWNKKDAYELFKKVRDELEQEENHT